MRQLVLAVLLLIFANTVRAADAHEAPTTPIGAAKLDVTPDEPIRLHGYGGRRAESEGVAQRIWAKALAIGADEEAGPAVLITLENCGMTPAIREEVAKQLEEKAGVDSTRLVISVSHSHTAPALTDWAPFIFGTDIPQDHQERIDQYTQEVVGKLVDVAVQALAQRKPGTLSWAKGEVGFAMNRRVLDEGSWTGFGEQPDGPVDHSLPVLIAKDEAGKLIAVMANYACHCTTLGGDFNEVAGDWAGYAQQYIEQEHPGAVALITIGCGADANPSPRGGLEVCRQHGRELADEVNRLLETELTPVSPELTCRMLHIDLPFDELPTEQEWQERAEQQGTRGYHARQFLKRLEQGREIPTSLSYPVATWTFGDDLAMVFLAGEVVVDYAIRLKSELDASRLWVTAYANDVPCYIASKRILREGGYEADHSMLLYARPTRLAPEAEEMIVDTVQKLLPHRFYCEEKQADFPPPTSPEQSLAAIHTKDELVVELVAAEPLIADPVAFDWGPDGRLWVAEIRDYPNGISWHRKGDPLGEPGGRIKVLTDDDGDGRYDRADVFLDGIPFPTGVKVWRNGILVSAAPEVFYAEDTDGDGKADLRETLYEGFGEGNQQHRVNGMRWGIDNWLYLANGDSGGTIKSLKTGEEVAISGRDLRIRPDEGLIEPRSGRTQFGRSSDDFGNWFGGNNSNPMWHYVLDDSYLRRNPHFAPPAIRNHVSVQPGAAPVFPVSRTLARFNDFDRADRFTSACSPIVFRDLSRSDRDPRTFTYVCEPVHNLVHREVLKADGVTFSSRRPPDETDCEFLASEDNWFRPVMVRTGPEGALWIADMYRFVVEHPEWIPADWQRKLDLRAGDQRGRIYRVRFPGIPNEKTWRTAQVPKLSGLDMAALVEQLDHPNGTRRNMIHQLLVWRQDREAIEPLKRMVGCAEWPPASLHALYLLDEFDALDNQLLAQTIRTGSASLARHAIRLAEEHVDQSPALGAAYLERSQELSDDPASQQEKLQLAYSLGEWQDPRAAEALARLALHYCDRYMTAAVLSSINEDNLARVLDYVLRESEHRAPPQAMVDSLLAIAVAHQNKPLVNRSVAVLASSLQRDLAAWQLEAVGSLLDAIEKQQASWSDFVDGETGTEVNALFADIRRLAGDPDADSQLRTLAIRLLGRGPSADKDEEDRRLLARLLGARTPAPLQAAAVRALLSRPRSQTPDDLLRDWDTHSPDLRAKIVDGLLSRTDWTKSLLASIEAGTVPASSIDARRRQQLEGHQDESIRERAESLFSSASGSGREKVLAEYARALELTGDPERGKGVFEKQCGSCHQLEGTGHSVGPDLVALTDKSPQSLLVAILDPNRAVEDKFLDYAAITDDGRQLSGMITSETGNSITLTGQEGKQQMVLRSELEALRSTGRSLMPDGLEKELSPQDVADVVAYVRSITLPPKSFPGNTPTLAPVRDDGSIRLFAMHSRIYGPSLEFERQHRNLGHWSSIKDHAVWEIEVPEAGIYRVVLVYACEDSTAGNRFRISVDGQTLGGVVRGTGSWDNYGSQTVGLVPLAAGRTELLVRSDGPVRGALMDLQSIRLLPTGE